MREKELYHLITNLRNDDKLEYNDYSDLHDAIGALITDHKAVVETLKKNQEIVISDSILLVAEINKDKLALQNKIETKENRILELEKMVEELKAVISGEYTGYYCAEHGAINGVEVTYYEKCAICGRDANHIPNSKGD